MFYTLCYKYVKQKLYNMKKGIIEKGDNGEFYVKFTETKYTDDGLDYIGDDIVEIHPDDVYKFNINDNNVGEEISFKIQTVMDRRPRVDEYVDVARLIN